MKKDQIKIGGTYMAKVGDKVVPVRLDAEHSGSGGGWDATNLVTNKKVRIKSAQRLRGPAPDRHAGGQANRDNAQDIDEQESASGGTPKGSKGKGAEGGVAKPKMAKKTSGLDAAAQVLKDAGEPMRCKDMVDTMMAKGLWASEGKTPAATIYSAIIREISVKGAESRFKKTDRGLFVSNA